MSIKSYISDAKTCKTFKGNWNPKTNKCNIGHIRKIINDARTVESALGTLNKEIEGYGVEPIVGRNWAGQYYRDINLLYVNKGDTYDSTVIYDTKKGMWYVGTSWGAIVESDEKRFDI